jgi:hypothetical protein
MAPTSEPSHQEVDPELLANLKRVRGAVLNVLVAASLMIAVSGWLLRGREPPQHPLLSRGLHHQLMLGLIVVAVASYTALRVLKRRLSMGQPGRVEVLFFWAHVLPASIAALAVPLGLLYGWLVDPRLEAVIPFWVVPLALGFLSLPRRHELDDVRSREPDPEATPQ